MANKGKTSSVPIPQSFKDPLTGRRIVSDTTYEGFLPLLEQKAQAYGSAQYEIEANNKQVVLTSRFTDWLNGDKPDREEVMRYVFSGNFSYSKTGNLSGVVSRVSVFDVQHESSYFSETAQSYNAAKGTKANGTLRFSPEKLTSASYFYSNLDANTYDYNGKVTGNSFDYDGRYSSTPLYQDRRILKGLADTGFFQEGWWQNPFAINLI